MFRTLLIANRGEIACRIARTCRGLGLRTVAVYSDADAGSLHVRACDAAMRIGPPPARESYLDGEAIIAAARDSGAEAIHPGYGFLSENADFAEAVAAAGLAFVGAPPAAMRALGSKSAARALMARAGIPILGGYHGDAQDDATLAAEADRVGYPLLVKPSAGGGGRGMRIVADADALGTALESARREAASSFGDDRLLLEHYLAKSRHIEVQVFADNEGNTVHLFERDCSAQRRHQKVIEEAPAPALSPAMRAALGETAVAAARAVGYAGAGTVEFLLDGSGFYFIEMNTRLQVEHPVTEAITGYDLVEWQLRVAAGEALPAAQEAIAGDGHAIEARLYAEDPAAGFLPSTGPIRLMRLPGEDARVDTGFEAGDAVTPHYDSLLAKVIVHAPTRDAARARLVTALAEVAVVGPLTNRDFLIRILADDAFAAGTLDTGHLDRNLDALTAREDRPPEPVLALAALAAMRDQDDAAGDPASPWAALRGWRLNAPARRAVSFHLGEDIATVLSEGSAFRFPGGRTRQLRSLPAEAPWLAAEIDGKASTAVAVCDAGTAIVFASDRTWRLPLFDPVAEAEAGAGEAATGVPLAPMPGVVVAVAVAGGDRVEKDQPLLVIEAMKVEHTIRAPCAGTVDAVHYAVGDRVDEGAELAAFTPEEV